MGTPLWGTKKCLWRKMSTFWYKLSALGAKLEHPEMYPSDCVYAPQSNKAWTNFKVCVCVFLPLEVDFRRKAITLGTAPN